MPSAFFTYQITISYGTLRITSLSGPHKGAAQDSTVALTSGLLDHFQEGEQYHADAIYRNLPQYFICPVGPATTAGQTPDERKTNARIHRARQAVERVIKRFKYDFKCFTGLWRYSIEFHQKCVHAAAKLTNLNFELEPLDQGYYV